MKSDGMFLVTNEDELIENANIVIDIESLKKEIIRLLDAGLIEINGGWTVMELKQADLQIQIETVIDIKTLKEAVRNKGNNHE